MAEDGAAGRGGAPAHAGGQQPPEGGTAPDAPSQVSGDSLLRAAAQISELTPSEAQGMAGAARADLVAGAVIAKRYRLERELGRGGMGVVWEATHQVTRRRVAIKFVMGPAHLRVDLRRRFMREARAASAANHPNVIEVLDVFELEDGTPVMVMELLSGETLRDRILREKTLSLEATASILVPVVAAVGTAHALGIVHRDLKPENIFLVAGAEPAAGVKVLDFGVAKLLARDGDASETDSLTGTGSALGTPCYMAPEQTTGEKDIDARADIWAIGVIAYECLSGVRPVEGSGIGQVVMKLMTEGIKPIAQVVPGLPPEATALVMRMLTRERRDRPQDLREVQGVLAGFTSVTPRPFDAPAAGSRAVDSGNASPVPGGPATVVDTQSPQSISNSGRRTPRRSVVAGLVAGAALIAAFVGWRATARPPAATPGIVQSATGAATPGVQLVPSPAATAARDTTVANTAAPGGPAAVSPGATDALAAPASRAAPAARGTARGVAAPGAPSKADAAAATPVPVVPQAAPPKAPAGGLAEKPPF